MYFQSEPLLHKHKDHCGSPSVTILVSKMVKKIVLLNVLCLIILYLLE